MNDRVGNLSFEDFVLRRQQHINAGKSLDIQIMQKEAELEGLHNQRDRHLGALQELEYLIQQATRQPEQANPAADPNAESDM